MYVPQKMFFTKGVGRHKDYLQSFELALRDAKIEKCNLVTVSSIFPPGCKRLPVDEGGKLSLHGQRLQRGEIPGNHRGSLWGVERELQQVDRPVGNEGGGTAGVGLVGGGADALARWQRAHRAVRVVSVSTQRLRDAQTLRRGAASGGG